MQMTENSARKLDGPTNGVNSSCLFNDGVRKIDYVLVWEEDLSNVATMQSNSTELRNARCRKTFQANLTRTGIEVEMETSVTTKKRIHFLKLFVTWETMCQYAERLRLRAPLMVLTKPSSESELARTLKSLNPLRQTVPNTLPPVYTCILNAAKVSRFLGSDNQSTFFTPTQRHTVAYEILATQAYGDERMCEFGIDRMVEEDIYSCAFPLHEGPFERLPVSDSSDEVDMEQELNTRQTLHMYWARLCTNCVCCKYQPLNNVRDYFGEKIAFYFAWLGFYTAWLMPATLVGIAVFAYGCATLASDVPSNDACNSNTSFKMCPICDENEGCRFWYLSDICWKVKLIRLFDHPGTVFYAIFMSLWAVTFLEFWQRKGAALSHSWGVWNYHAKVAMPRPSYTIGCTSFRNDPITGNMEPHFPHRKRLFRMTVSTICLILMLFVVVASIQVVIVCNTVIRISLFRNPIFRPAAKIIGVVVGSLLQLVILLILEKVYESLSYMLTGWEMHRTQATFEDQLALKVFAFEVCNYYMPIFYIAFIKGRFAGYPGNYVNDVFGFRVEECDDGGCLLDLALNLVIIMIGRQIFRHFVELLEPVLLARRHRYKKGISSNTEFGAKPWEADYSLIPYDGLFAEYMKMVLQFGFITIFVAACPLAPLFAMLNNWLEIRVDAKKLISGTRRPLTERVQGIGVWHHLLQFIAVLAVISNACLIAFTSESLTMVVYMFEYKKDLRGFVNFTMSWSPPNATSEPCRYRDFRDMNGNFSEFYWRLLTARLVFVIAFEHLVFSVRHLLITFIPSVPKELRMKILKENYLAKQALVVTDVLQQQQQQRQQQM